MNKKVIIIGSGPGGLASAMILSKRGFDVTVYERKSVVGGRTSPIKTDGFTFDVGPTFVMLPQVFEEIFSLSGKNLYDYVKWQKLETLYRLRFGDGRDFNVYFDKEKLKNEIARLFPGDEKNYEKYLAKQKIKFEKMYPCLKVPYEKWYHYLKPRLLKALPYMNNLSSIYDVLSKYFINEDMKISMTFQAKYLGMSPWHCPGAFTILSYIEHAFGIFHPIGGVHKITEAMAKVTKENGGKIFLDREVENILIENGKAAGVKFKDGSTDRGDYIVMNSDFGSTIKKFVPEKYRKNWNDKKLENSPLSCSTFMLYLGLKKKYGIPHHNIFFAKDYKKNINEIFEGILPEDPSFYIQNASVTDNTLAPENKSTIYVLVPVPNNKYNLDWQKLGKDFRNLVIEKIIEKTEMKDLRDQIETERVTTPLNWQNDMYIFKGAVFNLAHTINQMLYLRPHNKFENLKGLYLVGGGTHPGSGLPTIIESGRITADIISEKEI